jgi:hypothetical protein
MVRSFALVLALAISVPAFAETTSLLCKGKDGVFRVMFPQGGTPVLIDVKNGGDVINTTRNQNGTFQLVEESFGDGETTISFTKSRGGRSVMTASDVDENNKPLIERFSCR